MLHHGDEINKFSMWEVNNSYPSPVFDWRVAVVGELSSERWGTQIPKNSSKRLPKFAQVLSSYLFGSFLIGERM